MPGKRLGLFGNAKYSRPVFKNVSNVMNGVNKDIALLVRHETSREVRKWANAPHASNNGDGDSSIASSAMINAPSKRRQSNHLYRTMDDIACMAHPVGKKHKYESNEFQSNVAHSVNNVDKVLQDLASGSSDAKNQRQQKLSSDLQPSPPFEAIAKNVLAACPKITLRDSDSIEYSEQVFSIAKNALLLQINKKISHENSKSGEDSVSQGESAQVTKTNFCEEKNNTDLYQSICNKTAIFDDDSDVFDEGDVLDTESPTRIYNVTYANRTDNFVENEPSQFFNSSVFDTQRSDSGSSFNDFQFQNSDGVAENGDRSSRTTQTISFFKRPAFDKSVSFNFGQVVVSDEEYPSRSQVYSSAAPVSRATRKEQQEDYCSNKDELFLDNLSFDFANNAPLPSNSDGCF